MKVGVIIPFRGLGLGKTRLRTALPGPMVDLLSERMIENVISAVLRAVPDAPVVVITQTRAGLNVPLRETITVLEQALGLNEAIEFARLHLLAPAVERIAVLPSDLPLIQPDDIGAMLAAAAEVAIAPDTQGRGTNALVFPAAEVSFCRFGANSGPLHAAEAARRNLSAAIVRTPTLARDVDTIDQIDNVVGAACRMSFMDKAAAPGLVEARNNQRA